MDEAELRIERPSLRRLHSYWEEKRRGRAFPARADIDPLELGFVLGDVSLVDVLHDPLRFRIRLQGSTAASRLGWDLTGRFIDEIPDPEYRALTLKTYQQIVVERRPRHEVREVLLDDKVHRYEIVWLPLSDDDKTINMVVSCVSLFDR